MPFDKRNEPYAAERSVRAMPCQQIPPEKAHGRLLLLDREVAQFKVDNALGRAPGFSHVRKLEVSSQGAALPAVPGRASEGTRDISVCGVSLQRFWSWVGRVNI